MNTQENPFKLVQGIGYLEPKDAISKYLSAFQRINNTWTKSQKISVSWHHLEMYKSYLKLQNKPTDEINLENVGSKISAAALCTDLGL